MVKIYLSAALAVLLSLAGCEMFLAARGVKTFPPPGQLVDLNGRNLQLDCRGSGSPTVLLEAGADVYGSLAWAPIHESLAASTRVCAYSHAGTMWSDSRRQELETEGTAIDLRLALQRAAESPPFVLVGHSRGAIYNLIFNDLYDGEVSGLVFLDPRHPELDERRVQANFPVSEQPLTLARFARALRWSGLPRLAKRCNLATSAPEINAACNQYFPHSLDGYISETEILPAISARGALATKLGDKPVIVLTRQYPVAAAGADPTARAPIDRYEALWRSLNAEYASWSSRGEQRLVPDTNHQMLISHPASIEAVKEMVLRVRGASPITQQAPSRSGL